MPTLTDNTNRIRTLIGGISGLPNDRYDEGYSDGYTKGHTDGMAERQHEVWTITLVDGTVVEKEVALL